MRLLLFVSSNPRPVQAGFTLLELLVVITVMGILSTVAVLSYEGLQEQGQYDATRFEMTEIRNALLQFRRDSGSNDFPGQGQYDCTDAANGNPGNANPDFNFPPEAGGNDSEKIAWCRHPANFWMLFVDPFGRATDDQWNEDTHRGWHGPYLQRIDLPDNIDTGFTSDGAGNGRSGSTTNALWLIKDAYKRAYLMFDLDDADAINPARLVSLGGDRDYAGGDTSDCSPPNNTNHLVLCLRR